MILSATNLAKLENNAGNLKNTRYKNNGRDYAAHKDGRMRSAANTRRAKDFDANIIPIWSNPNYYCRSCKRSYCAKYEYHYHIKTIHMHDLQESMQLASSSSSSSKPT